MTHRETVGFPFMNAVYTLFPFDMDSYCSHTRAECTSYLVVQFSLNLVLPDMASVQREN